MTLSPQHTPHDLGTADGITKYLKDIINGTEIMDTLKIPKDGGSIVNMMTPNQAQKILTEVKKEAEEEEYMPTYRMDGSF